MGITAQDADELCPGSETDHGKPLVARSPGVWIRHYLGALALTIAGALAAESSGYEWDLPTGFPPPAVPEDNPMSQEKVDLGARLFSDPRLSSTGTYSCASCHVLERHFTDGLPQAIGATGATLQHNTPTLLNSAYNSSFGWTDTGLETLERQHLVPLTNDDPVEMGFDTAVLAGLNEDAELRSAFAAAFGSPQITLEAVVRALASYVRTLIRGGSAFDRLLFDNDRNALDESALRGLELFTSPRLGCAECHAGFNLSGPIRYAGAGAEPSFHHTGVSGSSEAYRAPTLRFLRFTPPYMHDGSQATLAELISFYEQGGGPGRSELRPFVLSDAERRNLIAFLNSL